MYPVILQKDITKITSNTINTWNSIIYSVILTEKFSSVTQIIPIIDNPIQLNNV